MPRQIPFKTGNNYFAKKSATTDRQLLIIGTRNQCDSLLGAAAVMGRGGQPTDIDFSKQTIIGIVMPDTDQPTEITPTSLTQTSADTVTVAFSTTRHEPSSYTMRPFAMIVVQKKDIDGKTITLQETTK